MEISFYQNDDLLVCYLRGEIDHHISENIRNQIDEMIERYHVKKLVFDFKEVTFMDSSGIGMILGRHKKLQSTGGIVQIKNPNEMVKRILHMAGVFFLIELLGEGDAVNGK